ncbi:unnamed protein product [Acanthoscelides obtectus]|uniref:Major facilitator superfamily (MFS) profile domain-containing protein n=1 Tax=Acanthoscelides obtectus TaxID=200917 RepID=A0A9P0LEZ8_ACAOB|nr:unnamed protein product [Acanthoscelides obtectus]CAK1656553.1 Facilitated trehalose transporter Tret1 [Acanthoscelides obtectus]
MVQNTFRMNNEGRYWPQVLAIGVGSLGCINNGLQYGWTSPFIVKITKDKENYDITEDEASYFATMPALAMMISCSLFSYLTHIIGPKKTYLLGAFPYIISWILLMVAKEAYVFYISRFFAGMTDGIMFASFPMYMAEITEPKIRGTFGNGQTVAIYFGQFAINVIGTYLDVKKTSYICVVVPVLFLILFPMMPESPYYLIRKGKYEEAKEALKWLRRKPDIEEDFAKLKSDVQRQTSDKGTWNELFTVEPNRKALLAGLFLRLSQQLSGLQVFAVYTKYIFEKSGSNLDPDMSTMVYAAMVLIVNTLTCFMTEYIGRRKAYMFSLGTCAVVLWILGIYFVIDQFYPQVDLGSFQWVPLTGLICFTVFSAFGVTMIPTLMLGELFSASIKPKGMMVLIVVFGAGITSIYQLFYYLNTKFGMYCPFLVFAACSTVSSVLTKWLVPETKGMTLEEIQQYLTTKKKSLTNVETSTNSQTAI